MKKILIHLSFYSGLIILLLTFNSIHQPNKNYPENDEPKNESDYDYFYAQRSYPYNRIDYAAYQNSASAFRSQLNSSKVNSLAPWLYAGPNNIGGRIVDIEMHPTNQNIAYLGAASGGIFKTINGGADWLPVFDSQSAMSIGDLAISQSNPDIIFVGTGEPNGGSGSLTYDANGIYKSVDAGVSWNNVGLDSTRMTGKIVINPNNPDTVFAATMGDLYGATPNRGLYRTTDGGITWQKVLFLNDSTGAIDVVINPQNTSIVYAAMWERVRRVNHKRYSGASSGLYKSSDGGTTWTQLTNGLPAPGSDISRIGIDLCNSQPNIVYAKYVDASLTLSGIYKSTDDGASWAATDISSIPMTGGSGEYWFGKIKVDPTDPDIVYQIGFDMYKTNDGGSTWFNSFYGTHVDHHAIAIHPLNNYFVMNGCDGGLNISNDGGDTWTHHQDLPITQFYCCELDNSNPAVLFGGTQDNNCIRTLTGSLYDWDYTIGGDGFYCLIDPVVNNFQYCEYQYGNIFSSTDGGMSWNYATTGIYGQANWNCPITFDPQNTSTLFTGAQQVFRSDDHAQSWYSISPDLVTINPNGGNLLHGTISTIDVSPLNSNIIYVGTDNGKVWMTNNAGVNWTNVTGTLPQRWITHVTCDPFVTSRAYVTISGYRFHDNAKHVYMTNDNGTTWQDISGNLPDVPMNDLVADADYDSVLYAASDVGVFITTDLGANWQPLGTGMPTLVCMDLRFHHTSRTLLVATYGRGMYKYDLSLFTSLANHNEENHLNITVSQNPVNQNSVINLNVSKSSKSLLTVYDLNGKVVATKSIGNLKQGATSILWGDIVGNKTLNAGSYVLSFSDGVSSKNIKVVVVG